MSCILSETIPKKTITGYKVFMLKDGLLYPPMVANPGGAPTPVGVWIDASEGEETKPSKTGRRRVKSSGKGTAAGKGSLAYRPGWHIGKLPLAPQFNRVDKTTGLKTVFPENFVWALVEASADIDYQKEAMSYGYTKNGKFRHSYAGLPKLPINGCYHYRTNPNPNTPEWIIAGSMKIIKILTSEDINNVLLNATMKSAS